jgi:putative transposase
MVSPSSRRGAAKYLVEEGLANAAQACRALGLGRSSYYLVGQKRLSSQKLERKIIALSEEHPRYGYRRITALMRRKGRTVNAKRVQRVRRQAGLQVLERQRRTRRLGPIEASAGRNRCPRPKELSSPIETRIRALC